MQKIYLKGHKRLTIVLRNNDCWADLSDYGGKAPTLRGMVYEERKGGFVLEGHDDVITCSSGTVTDAWLRDVAIFREVCDILADHMNNMVAALDACDRCLVGKYGYRILEG